jgi:hypothetical protein
MQHLQNTIRYFSTSQLIQTNPGKQSKQVMANASAILPDLPSQPENIIYKLYFVVIKKDLKL